MFDTTTLTLRFGALEACDTAQNDLKVLDDKAWWNELYSGRTNVKRRVKFDDEPEM